MANSNIQKPLSSVMGNHNLSIFQIIILLLGIICSSCSKDDGDWESMKWKTEVSMGKNRQISVSAIGATYLFTCTNYDCFWISEVQEEASKIKQVYYDNDINCDPGCFETFWGKVSVFDNKLTVELYPNQSSEKRQYLVGVTAGDVFCTFTFVQAGN